MKLENDIGKKYKAVSNRKIKLLFCLILIIVHSGVLLKRFKITGNKLNTGQLLFSFSGFTKQKTKKKQRIE